MLLLLRLTNDSVKRANVSFVAGGRHKHAFHPFGLLQSRIATTYKQQIRAVSLI